MITDTFGSGRGRRSRGFIIIYWTSQAAEITIGTCTFTWEMIEPRKYHRGRSRRKEEIEEERMERERIWRERQEQRKKRGDKIALTPSLEKIDIKFVQPNMQIIESMDRLIAVPSEKLRVWSCWLSMVGEEVHEWRYWLLSQINLVLRMSEIMMKIESKGRELSIEEKPKVVEDERRKNEVLEKKNENTIKHTAETNDENPIDTERELDEENFEKDDPEPEKVDDEIEKEISDDTPVSEESSSDTEPKSDANAVAEDREEQINADESSNGKATDEIENEGVADSHEGEADREEGNVWPIGLPWKPKKCDKKEDRKKEELEKVKIIPIPRNEEEMMKLILDVRHKTTIYRSLYKHWTEIGDRAKGEFKDRDVMKTDMVHTHEEIPYFFYLKCEPDVDIGVKHDDEQILLPDLTRERISSNYVNLFYNLADKPGKGCSSTENRRFKI